MLTKIKVFAYIPGADSGGGAPGARPPPLKKRKRKKKIEKERERGRERKREKEEVLWMFMYLTSWCSQKEFKDGPKWYLSCTLNV